MCGANKRSTTKEDCVLFVAGAADKKKQGTTVCCHSVVLEATVSLSYTIFLRGSFCNCRRGTVQANAPKAS